MNLATLNSLAQDYKGLIDVAAVVATAAAVFVSLKNARDTRDAKLRLQMDDIQSTAEIMYSSSRGTAPEIPGSTELRVYNKGYADVYIRRSGLNWRIPFSKFSRSALSSRW